MSGSHLSEFRVVLSDSDSIAVALRLAADLRRALGEPAALWYDRAGGMQPGETWWRALVAEAAGRPVLVAVWSRRAGDAQASRGAQGELDHLLQRAAGPSADTAITLIRRQRPVPADRQAQVALLCIAADLRSAIPLAVLLTAVGGAPAEGLAPAVQQMAQPASAEAAMSTTSAYMTPATGRIPQPFDAPAPGLPSRLLLLSIDELWPPARVKLLGATVTVGRESSNDVPLLDPCVSRFHLRLARQGVGWRVARLPDAKPMYVNGERRESAWLGHGDQIVIGGSVLRMEQRLASPRAAVVPGADTRAVLAAGLAPELAVESPTVRFTSPLRSDVVTVGRAPECTVVLTSPLVSRHLALLRRLHDGSYQLEAERDATNPVMLDGRPVRRRTLQSHDVLTLGSRVRNQYVTLTYLPAGAATP